MLIGLRIKRGNTVQFSFISGVVKVNITSAEALFQAVTKRFASKEGFAIATINLDHLVKLNCSTSFLKAYLKQDFIVADGNPIVWLSRLAKRPVELVPGSELVIPLARLAAENNISIALLGSTQEALQQAANGLQKRIPNLKVATCIAPPFGFDPTDDQARGFLAALTGSGAGLCFLALGAPKQEEFAALGRQIAPNIGFVSIGAGLDFIAGSQTRAPIWVQKLALEWVWRMLSSPRRLVPRYARCAWILPRLALDALKLARNG